LVSRNPICNFWRYLCQVHKIQIKEIEEIAFALNKLNKLRNESDISSFLRERSNFEFDSRVENDFLLDLEYENERK
jgi:hypothetical protein